MMRSFLASNAKKCVRRPFSIDLSTVVRIWLFILFLRSRCGRSASVVLLCGVLAERGFVCSDVINFGVTEDKGVGRGIEGGGGRGELPPLERLSHLGGRASE